MTDSSVGTTGEHPSTGDWKLVETLLHEALDKAKVTNKLITIKGGDHGGFSQKDYVNSFKEIKDFLRQNKIIQ